MAPFPILIAIGMFPARVGIHWIYVNHNREREPRLVKPFHRLFALKKSVR